MIRRNGERAAKRRFGQLAQGLCRASGEVASTLLATLTFADAGLTAHLAHEVDERLRVGLQVDRSRDGRRTCVGT